MLAIYIKCSWAKGKTKRHKNALVIWRDSVSIFSLVVNLLISKLYSKWLCALFNRIATSLKIKMLQWKYWWRTRKNSYCFAQFSIMNLPVFVVIFWNNIACFLDLRKRQKTQKISYNEIFCFRNVKTIMSGYTLFMWMITIWVTWHGLRHRSRNRVKTLLYNPKIWYNYVFRPQPNRYLHMAKTWHDARSVTERKGPCRRWPGLVSQTE